MLDRRYSPFNERKEDPAYSLYQLAKSKQHKEKPSSAKIMKSRDVQVKKSTKSGNRPSEKLNEKLAIYQYIQNKGPKRSEESKILSPSLQHTPTRHGSKSHFQEEKDYSHERKIPEASILQHRQLIEALEEMRRSKSKSSNYVPNHSSLAFMGKTGQKSSQSSSKGKILQNNSKAVNMMKIKREQEDSKRMSDSKKNSLFKDMKMQMEYQASKPPKERGSVKHIEAQQQQQYSAPKKHRRGLSSGQNPIFLEQQLAMQQLAMQQLALEQERARQHQLQMQMQQQQLQQQQLHQQQMEQYIMKDPQQEEDEFYEEFFHMDKMTFGFEKLIISQKLNQPQFFTPIASPTQSKQVSHHRTKSIDEPNNFIPTKSTSTRWTTKKSSVGDEHHIGGREKFNIIEQMSDLDRTNEREELRRYYKAKDLI